MSSSSESNIPKAYDPSNKDTALVNASSVSNPLFEKYSTNWTITSVSVSDLNVTSDKYSLFSSS